MMRQLVEEVGPDKDEVSTTQDEQPLDGNLLRDTIADADLLRNMMVEDKDTWNATPTEKNGEVSQMMIEVEPKSDEDVRPVEEGSNYQLVEDKQIQAKEDVLHEVQPIDSIHAPVEEVGQRGATVGPTTIMVEEAPPRLGKRLRTMMEVMMEPGKRPAPPKRRKRVAKRSKDLKSIGTIEQYLINMNIPKEWNKSPMIGGVDGGSGAGMPKRKGDLPVDVWSQAKRLKRTDELSVEDNFDAVEHTNLMILGAKSGGRDETTGRLQINDGKGLDLIPLTKNEGGIGSLGLDETTGEFK